MLGSSAPSVARGQDRSVSAGEEVRVVDDGATGDRWLLLRDGADPGGPGRMVRVESAESGSENGAGSEPAQASPQRAAHAAAGSAIHPVVRAGDAIVVEEHTKVVDARLEATALASAGPGSEFQARLKIGGKVIRVVALGQGRAELEPDTKARP